MNLSHVFYSIAACCLLMTIFTVSKVSAYSGYNYSEQHYEGIWGGPPTSSPFLINDVRRYKTTSVYDFRGRNLTEVMNIKHIKNDQTSVILFNNLTVFPEGFDPYSGMSCNQSGNNEILCFYAS